MKTLNEYLERNNYNIVKSLMDALSIDEESAKQFYKSVSPFDEGKLLDAIKEPVSPEDMEYVKSLYASQSGHVEENYPEETGGTMWDKPSDFQGDRYVMKYIDGVYNIIDLKTNKVIDAVHSGHEAQNVLYWYNSKKEIPTDVEEGKKKDTSVLAGKAAAGGYDMAKELSKGQYQPKIVQNKKHKDIRQKQKSDLKRGVYEKRVSPVLESTESGIQFKLVESTEITKDQIVLESSIALAPLGGLSAVNGLGMNSLRKMSGIVEQDDETDTEDQDVEELNETMTPEMADVMAFITNMDDQTRSLLMGVLSLNVAKKPAMTAEQMLCVKEAIREFGCALQCWIDDACGALDFLCPLVEALWIKYNEFCV